MRFHKKKCRASKINPPFSKPECFIILKMMWPKSNNFVNYRRSSVYGRSNIYTKYDHQYEDSPVRWTRISNLMSGKLRPSCLSADSKNPNSSRPKISGAPSLLLWCVCDCACACAWSWPRINCFLPAESPLAARRTSVSARRPWTCSGPLPTPWTPVALTCYCRFIFISFMWLVIRFLPFSTAL